MNLSTGSVALASIYRSWVFKDNGIIPVFVLFIQVCIMPGFQSLPTVQQITLAA